MAEMTAREMTPAASPRAFDRMRGLAQSVGLLWVLFILCGVAVWLSPNFLQIGNLLNVGRQVALFGIVSVGMTFVILTRGIDLSVGSIVGVVAVASAMMLAAGVPIPLTVAAALTFGALLGAVNGIGIAYFGMPPFIMTLGMLVIGRGIAMTLANGEPQSLGAASDTFYFLGGGFLLGIPVPIWIFAGDRPDRVRGAAPHRLRPPDLRRRHRTRRPRASPASPVPRVLMSVYVISGLLSALTALIFVSRLTVGEPTAGTNLELEAISIVVIGGTSLFGGEGGVGRHGDRRRHHRGDGQHSQSARHLALHAADRQRARSSSPPLVSRSSAIARADRDLCPANLAMVARRMCRANREDYQYEIDTSQCSYPRRSQCRGFDRRNRRHARVRSRQDQDRLQPVHAQPSLARGSDRRQPHLLREELSRRRTHHHRRQQ